MRRPRIHSALTKWRPVPVRRALAQTEQPAGDVVDERHTVPWMAIVTGLLGLAVLAELIYAIAVTS